MSFPFPFPLPVTFPGSVPGITSGSVEEPLPEERLKGGKAGKGGGGNKDGGGCEGEAAALRGKRLFCFKKNPENYKMTIKE